MVTNPNNSPRWITHLCILLLLLASLTATQAQSTDTPVEPGSGKGFTPPPPAGQDITRLPVRKHDGEKVPREWIDKIHKAAPGDDWQAIEAHSIRQLLAAKKSNLRNNIPGTWIERGPSNIPGRIVDLAIDYTHNHLYAHSDHGIIFRSDDLESSNWTPLNDQHPLGLDVASQLAVFDDGHIVTTGWIKVDNFWGVYHSNDGGITWSPSTGFSAYEPTGIRRMARQEDTLFVLMQEYDFTNGTDYYTIYRSMDKGNTFSTFYRSTIPVGDGGRHRKSDLWVSNDVTHPHLYLMLEDSLFLVDKTTGSRTFNSTISNLPVDQALLTGLTQNGTTELTAYIATGGIGTFHAWNSTDQTWTYKGELTDWWLALPFGPNSFSCSRQSADILYFGGILTSKSSDRGATWTTMDLDPTGSYALYHGDVPKTFTTFNPNTQEEDVYLGTDGGIYHMDENEHFNSISIPGLNCTQIYKMTSRQSNPGDMFIGTQDNGYAHTGLGTSQPGIVDFTFQWGGDVTQVASGDGGATFWLWWLGDGCNYMSGPDAVVSTWTPYDYDGGIPYWEAPVWIPEQHPDRCYTAGFLNNSTGNHLIELQANPGGQATPTQFDYDAEAELGGKISAIAISPLDANQFYIATENGYFAHSMDGGQTWSSTLLAGSMYPRVIHPSRLNPGEVWVGGSGYSNSPVFHSTDNGQTFTALNTGLPACRVEAFATNEDESFLFAATSIAPFALDQDDGTWSDIAGSDAPLVQYMDVEFIATDNTARFATYARGVWDFRLQPTNALPPHTITDMHIHVYPHPAHDHLYIDVEDHLIHERFRILDATGKIMMTDNLTSMITEVPLSGFPPGMYTIVVDQYAHIPVTFIKL